MAVRNVTWHKSSLPHSFLTNLLLSWDASVNTAFRPGYMLCCDDFQTSPGVSSGCSLKLP